ncbi:MAG: glycosyltransferase, partial [Candidatus Aenigmarchaeota archaeon]|nr:glycosyltransferase [Candidatus Aenigmarchaeota archaeon]
MRVTHIISGNAGGSFSAGENIADKHEKIYCKSSGLFGILRSFLLSLRLHFSPCGIVHFHDALPGYFYTLLPHSKKVVYTSHGHWSGFFAALPPKGFFQRLKSLLLVHTQNKLIERADAVVAVSKKVEGIIKKGTGQKNVSVIYNGVDLKLFSAGREEKVANNALWVGDNPEMKGLQKAIKIAQGKRMKLLVVGIDGKSTPEI